MKGLKALARLFIIARSDTGQARRFANFLLAWHNAAENGGWDPVDLWNADEAIADDLLTVLGLLRSRHEYPDDLGFRPEMEAVWQRWRSVRAESAGMEKKGRI